MNAVIRLSESISHELNEFDARLRALESGAVNLGQSGIPVEIIPGQITESRGENVRSRVLGELKDLFAKKKNLNL